MVHLFVCRFLYRVFEIIDQNIEARSQRAQLEQARGVTPGGPLLDLAGKMVDPTNASLKLRGVSFTYASRPEAPVLRDLTVSIQPRTFTCFVGKSGTGKSTLVAVLSGLLFPQEGSILLGGVPLMEGGRYSGARWLHANVGVVQQHDKSLMSGTIRENIEYGKAGASQEEVERAAKAASAHDFIVALPGGYDSEVRYHLSFLFLMWINA